jgi:hypothetical protein
MLTRRADQKRPAVRRIRTLLTFATTFSAHRSALIAMRYNAIILSAAKANKPRIALENYPVDLSLTKRAARKFLARKNC